MLIIKEELYSAGTVIFKEGEVDSDACAYVIKKGRVDLQTSNGRRLCTLGSNAEFGQAEFFTGAERAYTAVAREVSILLKIKRSAFLHIIHSASI